MVQEFSRGPGPQNAEHDPDLIECRSVTKAYGGVKALTGVDFNLRRGEVHALLGQNGAGKSTLIKILSGVTVRDDGTVRFQGEDVHFTSTKAALDAGLAAVYQDLSLAPNLSVADNFLLGSEPKTRIGLIDRRAMARYAETSIAEFNIKVKPTTIVGTLPFADRQLLEIAKALSRQPKILVLDEPTSALSESEEKILFQAIERVIARGVGVIHITHRLKEVFQIANRVTVIRDGRNVMTCATHQTGMAELVESIFGKALEKTLANAPVSTAAETRLQLRDLNAPRVNNLTMDVRRGEVVGLAGMVGSGRTDILNAIFAITRPKSGEMEVDGESYSPSTPADAIRAGVAMVPEDRHVQGLVLEHSIERNLSTAFLERLQRLGFVRKRLMASRSLSAMVQLKIKAQSKDVAVRTLSGGNQQKVVFGKWIEPRPKVLLLDEPTVGVDVAARQEIYGTISRMAKEGTSVIVASSEMEELLLICSRIAIIRSGHIVRWVDRSELQNESDLHRLVQVHS